MKNAIDILIGIALNVKIAFSSMIKTVFLKSMNMVCIFSSVCIVFIYFINILYFSEFNSLLP